MRELKYNRTAAVDYARKWALHRNPAYYDFESIGGDCTNFASQCVFAGAGVMNFTPVTGWFYRSANDRTASWTGVEFFHDFLISNRSVGPYAREVSRDEVQPGDVAQLGGQNGRFYHTPVIIAVKPVILVAAHTFDTLDRPLDSYMYDAVRFLHIEGVRAW
jgi:hypothetical protein